MIKFTHFMPFAAMLCLSLFFSCTSDIKPYSLNETFTDDRDGKVYRYVTIGTQTWMAQNLNYDTIGSKCAGNSESNCAIYGRLYNWQTAMSVCPSGWHLPSNDEWEALMTAVDLSTAGTKLKATSGWNSFREIPSGTDNYGFSALPGGEGSPGGKGSPDVGYFGFWWSTSDLYCKLHNNNHNANAQSIAHHRENAIWYEFNKNFFLSVRCLQD